MDEDISPAENQQPAAPEGQLRLETARQRAVLEKLLNKQLRNFTALLSKVLAEADAEAVHDLRVCSRRLQQILFALVAGAVQHRAHSLRRTLRRVRRALGDWRNCDVALERIAMRERRAANPDRRRGWELVRQAVTAERKRVMNRAHRKLLKSGGFGLRQKVQQLIAIAAVDENPAARVRAGVADAALGWQKALTQAAHERSVQNIHAFRIQMKRLRYRVELACDLGSTEARPLVNWFKSLQDRLGHWHDLHELSCFSADALGSPEVLLEQPAVAVELLREIMRDRLTSSREVVTLFQVATESDERARLDHWLKAYCEAPDTDQRSQVAGVKPHGPALSSGGLGSEAVEKPTTTTGGRQLAR